MSDIIKASGLSSGSIYSHFSGKETSSSTAINERLNNVKGLYETLPEGAGPRIFSKPSREPAGKRQFSPAMLRHPHRIAPRSRNRQEQPRDTMPLLRGVIARPSPLGSQKLRVLHEINPDRRSRTRAGRRSLPITPAMLRTPS